MDISGDGVGASSRWRKAQARTAGCAKEAEVAHFHKAAWQDVLEEALDEMLHGEGAT